MFTIKSVATSIEFHCNFSTSILVLPEFWSALNKCSPTTETECTSNLISECVEDLTSKLVVSLLWSHVGNCTHPHSLFFCGWVKGHVCVSKSTPGNNESCKESSICQGLKCGDHAWCSCWNLGTSVLVCKQTSDQRGSKWSCSHDNCRQRCHKWPVRIVLPNSCQPVFHAVHEKALYLASQVFFLEDMFWVYTNLWLVH